MPTLCYERHPLNAAAITYAPRMAMDAAPVKQVGDEPDYENNLIAALTEWAARELTPEQAAKLTHIIENVSDPRAAVAKDKRRARDADPEIAEQAMDFLRSKGIDEKDIDMVRRSHFGLERPTQAMDSARRARAEESYAKTFPKAARIVGDAVETKRPVTASAAATASFHAMFPDAARLG